MEKLSESERQELASEIGRIICFKQHTYGDLADAAYAYIAPRVAQKERERLEEALEATPREQVLEHAEQANRAGRQCCLDGFAAGWEAHERHVRARLMPPPADAAETAAKCVLD